MRNGTPRRPKIAVDWKQYFDDFCEVHGRPLTAPGGHRLLFPDGWSYAVDYRGPEWPPPADPRALWRAKRQYWLLYRVGIARELARAKEELAGVLQVLGTRTVRPTLVSYVRDPDTGKQKKVTRPMDAAEFEQAVAGYEEDLASVNEKIRECDTELRLLRTPQPAAEHKDPIP